MSSSINGASFTSIFPTLPSVLGPTSTGAPGKDPAAATFEEKFLAVVENKKSESFAWNDSFQVWENTRRLG